MFSNKVLLDPALIAQDQQRVAPGASVATSTTIHPESNCQQVDEDVLSAHWKRNGTPKPPHPATLNQIRARTEETPAQPPHPQRLAGTVITITDTEPPEKHRATRNSKPKNSKRAARTMGHYPSHWQDVLNDAKTRFSAYLATVNAFPDNDEALLEAKECIYTALACHRKDGYDVEPGEQYLCCTFC